MQYVAAKAVSVSLIPLIFPYVMQATAIMSTHRAIERSARKICRARSEQGQQQQQSQLNLPSVGIYDISKDGGEYQSLVQSLISCFIFRLHHLDDDEDEAIAHLSPDEF